MVTRSKHDRREMDRARRLAASNPMVDISKVELLSEALEALEAMGLGRQTYNLSAPTENAHLHGESSVESPDDGHLEEARTAAANRSGAAARHA